MALNMKDAYFHIDIHLAHQKFLCFTVGHSHYQFRVLAVDIATAPHVFKKIFTVISTYVRHFCHSVFPCMDNWLRIATLHTRLLSPIHALHDLLTHLDIYINEEKSVLNPTQAITFTGAHLNSIVGRTFLLTDLFAALTSLSYGPGTFSCSSTT